MGFEVTGVQALCAVCKTQHQTQKMFDVELFGEWFLYCKDCFAVFNEIIAGEKNDKEFYI